MTGTDTVYRRVFTSPGAVTIGRCDQFPVILDLDWNLVEPINRWFIALARRGLATSTVRAYSDAVLDWLRTIDASQSGWGIDRWEDAREEHLVAYWSTTEASASRSTANQFVLRVALFYDWAYRSGLIRSRPWPGSASSGPQHFRKPSLVKDPRVYTDEELIAVTRNLSPRDKLIAKWALLTGARRAEISSLTIDDIYGLDESASSTTLVLNKTKAGRPQNLLVPAALAAQTKRFIHVTRAIVVRRTGASSTAVFLTNGGNPVSPSRITKNWTAARRKAGLSDGVFHDLRHTFADGLLADLLRAREKHPELNVEKALQIAVRHASVTTTYRFYISAKQQEKLLIERALSRRAMQLRWGESA